MKIEDFIREVMKQISASCNGGDIFCPRSIEFSIQVNSDGEICKPQDVAITTIKISL